MADLIATKEYRSIDEVPTYRWKTPLQQAIQILKRHRDVVFKDNPEWAPISMIITILAARSYQGERTVKNAVEHIVARMPQFVIASKPRIPNPVNPSEDFADRWAADRRYEDNFWVWHSTLKSDLANLSETLQRGNVATEVRKLFKLDLTEMQLTKLGATSATSIPAEAKASPIIHIPAGPRPWQRDG